MLALILLCCLPSADDAAIRRAARDLREGDTDAWRRIPWEPTLGAAITQAAKEKRPLFVFSHEGNIDTGRC